MLYIIIRITLAVLLAVLFSKILFKVLRLKKIMTGDQGDNKRAGRHEEFIDICPECGQVREKNHKCL